MTKFFVPCANEPDDAEMLEAWLQDYLWERGLATTGRRIRALICTIRGADHYIAVGSDTPKAPGDPVMMIMEAQPEPDEKPMFFVFTLSQTAHEQMPYALSLDESWRVVAFE